MMGFFAPCTKSVIAEMRAVSPEQTQKMNHLREIDTLQKEKCVWQHEENVLLLQESLLST